MSGILGGSADGTSPSRVREPLPIHVGPRLRIAVVSPPMLPVPPATYAGTERVVAALVEELHAAATR